MISQTGVHWHATNDYNDDDDDEKVFPLNFGRPLVRNTRLQKLWTEAVAQYVPNWKVKKPVYRLPIYVNQPLSPVGMRMRCYRKDCVLGN